MVKDYKKQGFRNPLSMAIFKIYFDETREDQFNLFFCFVEKNKGIGGLTPMPDVNVLAI